MTAAPKRPVLLSARAAEERKALAAAAVRHSPGEMQLLQLHETANDNARKGRRIA